MNNKELATQILSLCFALDSFGFYCENHKDKEVRVFLNYRDGGRAHIDTLTALDFQHGRALDFLKKAQSSQAEIAKAKGVEYRPANVN